MTEGQACRQYQRTDQHDPSCIVCGFDDRRHAPIGQEEVQEIEANVKAVLARGDGRVFALREMLRDYVPRLCREWQRAIHERAEAENTRRLAVLVAYRDCLDVARDEEGVASPVFRRIRDRLHDAKGCHVENADDCPDCEKAP